MNHIVDQINYGGANCNDGDNNVSNDDEDDDDNNKSNEDAKQF